MSYIQDSDFANEPIDGPIDQHVLHKLLLEQIPFVKNFVLQGHALQNLNLRDKTDLHFFKGEVRRAVYELQTFILAEKLAHDTVPVYFSYPATWWDAFKLRFFFKWLLDKYPVNYTVVVKKVDFKQYALYPSINEVFPDYPKENIIIHSMTAVGG